MAVQARSSLEDKSSRGFLFIPLCWLLLPAYPGVEVFWGIHVYAQEHLRVLCPAVLCALTEKSTRLMGVDPTPVWPFRTQLCLSSTLSHPQPLNPLTAN